MRRAGTPNTTTLRVGRLYVTVINGMIVEAAPDVPAGTTIAGPAEHRRAVEACCANAPQTNWPYSPLLVHLGLLAGVPPATLLPSFAWCKRCADTDRLDRLVQLMLDNPKATLTAFIRGVMPRFGERPAPLTPTARTSSVRATGRVRRA